MLAEDLNRLFQRAGFYSLTEVTKAANSDFRQLGGAGNVIHWNTLIVWVNGRSGRAVNSPRNWKGLVAVAYVTNATRSELESLLSYFTSPTGPFESVEDLWHLTQGGDFRKKNGSNAQAIQAMLSRWHTELPCVTQTFTPGGLPVLKERRKDRSLIVVIWLAVMVAGGQIITNADLPPIYSPYQQSGCTLSASYPAFTVEVDSQRDGYLRIRLIQHGLGDIHACDWKLVVALEEYMGVCEIGSPGVPGVMLKSKLALSIYPTIPQPRGSNYACDQSEQEVTESHSIWLVDAVGIEIEQWDCSREHGMEFDCSAAPEP